MSGSDAEKKGLEFIPAKYTPALAVLVMSLSVLALTKCLRPVLPPHSDGVELFNSALGDEKIIVPESLLFETGKSEIKKEGVERLNEIGESLIKRELRRVVVLGYADETGSSEINKVLSAQRAYAVRKILLQYLPEEKLIAFGASDRYPETSPGQCNQAISESSKKICLSKDRRVEIWLRTR